MSSPVWAEVLRLLAGRPTTEAMVAELRRRGYTVTPPPDPPPDLVHKD